MGIRKRIAAGLLAGAVCIGCLVPAFSFTVQAQDYWPGSVSLSSPTESAIVMDVDSGTILYSQNQDTTHFPASITKIMTALLAVENCKLDEVVTFSHDAVYKNEGNTSHIAREEGEQMTMEQCLYGMMLESANECAYAIGEHVAGGSISKFVDMMNAKAKELGCKNTHFSNPNGLPDDTHYTTAYDMALIAQAAYKNQEFAKICGTKSYTIPPTNKHVDPTPLNNHHAMLNFYKTSKYLYDYCVGGKTGYTTEANSTLVTYAKKDNMTLVCVVMDAASPAHYTDTRSLFDYCFDNFTSYNVKDNADLFSQDLKKDAGKLSTNSKFISLGETGNVILPKTANFGDAGVKVVPVKKDKTGCIGKIEYTYAGRQVGGAAIVYHNTKKQSTYPYHNLSKKEGGSKVKYFQVDFLKIILVLLIVGVLIAGIYILHRESYRLLRFKSRHVDAKREEKKLYKKIHRRKWNWKKRK